METIQILKDLTSNILETMFFITQETEPLVKNFQYKFACNIQDAKFDIVLLFCEKTAVLMTENFLGIDKASTKDVQDTLKESVNIIVGNFLGALFPDSPKKINIPVMIDNINAINVDEYKNTLLYFKEEPLEILLKEL